MDYGYPNGNVPHRERRGIIPMLMRPRRPGNNYGLKIRCQCNINRSEKYALLREWWGKGEEFLLSSCNTHEHDIHCSQLCDFGFFRIFIVLRLFQESFYVLQTLQCWSICFVSEFVRVVLIESISSLWILIASSFMSLMVTIIQRTTAQARDSRGGWAGRGGENPYATLYIVHVWLCRVFPS